MTYYLGVDVATSCGWELLRACERGRPERSSGGVLSLARMTNLRVESLAKLAVDGAGGEVLRVALEEPYLDENPKTLKVLARFVGRFEQEFESRNIHVSLVSAQTWQTAVLGCGPRTPRAERKKLARIWAKAMFGRDLEEDEADAAGLAYYLATKGRLG